MDRRARTRAGTALALVAALVAGCGEPAGDDSVVDAASAGLSSVTFRLWDEAAADAYRESFDAFNAIHRDIFVEVEVVPRKGYAERVASDLAAGTMADIFWTTSDAVAAHAHGGDLLALGEVLGEDVEPWEATVTDLYTRDGELWAVPQVWDATVLFYNTDLVAEAGVDPTALTWDPAAVAEPAAPAAGDDTDPQEPAPEAAEQPVAAAAAPADTLRAAVRALTRDTAGRAATEDGFDAGAVAEHGINTDLTAPAVWLTYLAQLGGAPRAGTDLDLAGPEGQATFGYLAALPVVPTDPESVPARELFAASRLALFQSTSADMRYLAEHAEVEWAVAPVPAGPEGAVSVVDGVGAAANAATDDPEATAEVLRWLASSDGQSALASHGVGVPAAAGAQELFLRAWADRGVDAAAALAVDRAVTAAGGPQVDAALEAVRPVLAQTLHGGAEVGPTLVTAQRTAEATLGSGTPKTP